ncbi:MAG TPA: M3 family metallopeptidase, partial [Methylomirabilota bacterium]|nr:M3 family metallopeptidase [Methylomirabilota bacterium]
MAHTRPLPLARLAAAGLLALLAGPVVTGAPPARSASTSSSASADNAPFWTGKPTAAQFRERQQKRLALAKTAMEKMLAVKGAHTIENTLVPFDEIARQLDMAGSQSGLVEETNPDSLTRATAEAMSQEISSFVTDLSLNRKVYDSLAAIDTLKADAETRYYVSKTLRDFRLSGVDKDQATRDKIKKLNEELVLIGQEFGRNIREDKSTVTCVPADLEGLPQDFIDRHKPGADGKITLTVEYPDYIPVSTYAKSDDLRRRMYMAYQNRAYPKNIDVLDRMRQKRYELAVALGFSNYADCVMADKMTGSAATARAFIDRVVAASGNRQNREYAQLVARKAKDMPGATAINFWESGYYSEQVRKSDYAFDSQELRAYLPYDQVKQGVLDISAKLFGVEFRRVKDAPVWDPSVECYELFDKGKLAGRFYLDMHPRKNKYNHAAQFDVRTGLKDRQIPEAALICNFPGGEAGDPGLMEYADVKTFFHEFGHLLHTLFAGQHQWIGTGGIRTEHDFVEAPSQMLEEWMRDPKTLQTFAKHYQTHQPVPTELVDRMRRSQEFAKGLQVRRQMVYADLSLSIYDRDPEKVDIDATAKSMVEKYQPFAFVDGTHFPCSFGHLDGYSAVYYTYMWSSVIAKDLFSKFDKNDLL